MKKEIFTFMIAAGAVMSLGSCSLLNKVTGKSESAPNESGKEISQEAVLPTTANT